MIIAASLVLYSLLVLVFGPSVLRRLTSDGQAPRCGVAAWLSAIASVATTWLLAIVLFVIDLAGHWYRGTYVVSCLTRLRAIAVGESGIATQIAMLTLASGGTLAVAVMIIRLTKTLNRLLTRARDHADAVRLVGRVTGQDFVILDAVEAAAYCVPGRPPAIVVTTAAVAALDRRELGAVLAHERAHLTGHHPNIVAALRTLAMVFPRLRLMSEGAVEVSRLLEMRADDAATRKEDRNALVSGLFALAGVAPAEALGAADIAVFERVNRLSTPAARPARARNAALLSSTMTVMAAGPLATLAIAVSGTLMCGS